MFREAREVLAEAGIPWEAEDEEFFLDALWLAGVVPRGIAAPLLANASWDLRHPVGRADAGGGGVPSPADDGSGPEDQPDGASEALPAVVPEPPRAPGTVGAPSGAGSPGPALWMPGAKALDHELALGRALRPLKRRRPGQRATELDEAATVAAQADTDTPQLVLRARPERWLRLALVIDAGLSMALWERHCAELQSLLERSGAFRQVDVHRIRYRSGDPAVRLGRPWSGSTATRPGDTVADLPGRTMILVVTDGAGAAWRDGRMASALARWAEAGPTAVIHTLPRRLWAGTGVQADVWHVTSPRPGAPNRAWEVLHPALPPEIFPAPALRVPVLELNAPDLAAWAAATTATGGPTPLRLWMPYEEAGGTARSASAPVSAEDFGRAASGGAVRLAAHLAAMAPVSVPVMRLVHACLGGQRDLAPLAEVLLGGLLQPQPRVGGAAEGGRHRFFDFTPEAKDLLLDAVPTSDLIDVGDRVGERIEALVGRSSDFPAWLMPPGAEGADGDGSSRPFARLGPTLQRRFGLVPEAAAGSAVAPRPAEEWYAAIPGGRLSTSLRVLLGAAGYSAEDYAAEIAVPGALFAEYLDGTTVPPWSLVDALLRAPTAPRRPPAAVRDAVRDQYLDGVLMTSPGEVREAFAETQRRMRLSAVPRDAELLLLRLLDFLAVPPRHDPYTGTATFQAAILSQTLNQYGIVVDREDRPDKSSLRREDMLWRTDGHAIPIEIKASLPWTDVLDSESAGGSARVSFLIIVDDSTEGNAPNSPVPLRECVKVSAGASGTVVALRHHAWRSESAPPSHEVVPVTPPRAPSDPRTTFRDALFRLYEQAGSPSHAALSNHVSETSSSPSLAKSTVGAWLRGETVPSSGVVLAVLVAHLRQLARDNGHWPRTVAEFEAMRAEAARNPVKAESYEPRVCVAVSVVGYTGATSLDRQADRELVRDLVLDAAAREIPFFLSFDMGNRLLLLLPDGPDEAAMASMFLRDLSAGISRTLAERQSPSITVALDRGPVRVTESGPAGATVVRLARLLDSPPLRRSLLGQPSEPYGLIVSDALHPEVISRLPGWFEPVDVQAKGSVIKAWLRSPSPHPRPVGMPERSNAVLVGTAHYEHLPDLPGVVEGIGALEQLLSDTAGGAFAASRTHVVIDVPSAERILSALAEAAHAATHTLLVYLAGHTLVESDTGRLTFALSDTGQPALRGLRYEAVTEIVQRSAARYKIVVLDCSMITSGLIHQPLLAGERLTAASDGGAGHQAGDGTNDRYTVVLASSSAPGERPGTESSFTNAVVRVLEQGIPGGPEQIDAHLLYDEVRAAGLNANLSRRSWNEPVARSAPLALNRAYRPPLPVARDAH
ncbi:SAV_2336 N-terminal domain-related protein [Streptomyces liangshanensis]|uniref:SAV_2336 N-terminal domain-related protein n=1 Tax=Streptomyces liangshanensis TaxID=2717324 RepID=UPI0036D9A331